ncbi:hypothetical protein AAUPMB_17500, partial [Pasteurella multocida subsp. multocida str. Anand1_buffalo]
ASAVKFLKFQPHLNKFNSDRSKSVKDLVKFLKVTIKNK